MTGGSGRVRIAISMRRNDYDDIKRAADAADLTVSGYLRKAVADYRYITEAIERGATILVEESGTQREVVFR